ncbi:MAG: hypothetical protein C7B43_08055 [Sulfobacillus benefaciens]|uniref:Probable inorganic carbon transporter subunit DabB n=1 Tax=Sulfobacillus benefaciens TaxID=453960 RepID=A0A2T2X540_9FIRM|nr:MAG: hypothetical protein C7B43_08055 [Sulfobacillus benefaciens]
MFVAFMPTHTAIPWAFGEDLEPQNLTKKGGNAMPVQLSTLSAILMLILPWPLLLPILLGANWANRHSRLIKKLTIGSAWFALGDGIVITAISLTGQQDSKTFFELPLPWHLAQFALNEDVNSLSVVMMLLVALVGLIVSRYALTYMEGDPHEGSFHYWLSITLGSFLTVITAGNVWEFFVFWVATSLFLHHLLAFYPERPLALLAARKKYILHRIADLSLFIALLLVVHTLHTADFNHIMVSIASIKGGLPNTLQFAAALVLLSAVLKSAQVPLHGWLIQVMEAPTPVSALLHAGIIYTGTFLLMRMVPLMSRVPWTGDLLIVIGLISIATASLMMMTSTNIKGSLAYSTSAQMGFMLMELGLGLYALALLHIVSHSVYKAHAFLSSGSIVEYFRWPVMPAGPSSAPLGKITLSLVLGAITVMVTGWLLKVPLLGDLPITVMGIILAVALSHLISSAISQVKSSTLPFLWISIGISALVATLYFLLGSWFMALFAPVLPEPLSPTGVVQDALLGLIVMVFVALLLIQQMLPRLLKQPVWHAIFVHLYNDLYVDMIFSRWIQKFSPPYKDVSAPQNHESEPSLREVTSL